MASIRLPNEHDVVTWVVTLWIHDLEFGMRRRYQKVEAATPEWAARTAVNAAACYFREAPAVEVERVETLGAFRARRKAEVDKHRPDPK